MHTFGWNGGVHAANAFYEFMPAVLLNHAYGLFGAAVWGAAWRLVAYVRMATMGMTYGLDAVSARISTVAGGLSIKDLVHHSIKLQAFVAFPTGLVVFLLAQPLLQLWIGRELDNPAVAIPAAAVVAQILVFATTSRSIADGWMLILYGAGFVKRYAPLMLIGGLLSPIVSLVLLAMMPGGEPYGPDFFAPAIGFASVYAIFTMALLPLIARRCLNVSLGELMRPLGRPAIATILLIPVALVAIDLVESPWTLLHLIAVMGAMGVIYAVMAWPIVLNSAERARAKSIVRRVISRSGGRVIAGRRCAACGHDLHAIPPDTPCPACGGQQEVAE
jgi:O-antigen/teichoic acid export membrane protein